MEIYDGIEVKVEIKSCLYYIHEIIAGLRITNFLEFPNDAVALKSFIDFLKDKKDESRYYYLYKACGIDDANSVYPFNKCICRGDEAEIMLEKSINELAELKGE